jgi:hypothetical protein
MFFTNPLAFVLLQNVWVEDATTAISASDTVCKIGSEPIPVKENRSIVSIRASRHIKGFLLAGAGWLPPLSL